MTDDNRQRGGLGAGESFVVLGDLNTDPMRGDQVPGAIQQLLQHPRIDAQKIPVGASGSDETASFGLRVDYVLPSRDLNTIQAEVLWPSRQDPLARLLGGSDHRMVWAGIEINAVRLSDCIGGRSSGELSPVSH